MNSTHDSAHLHVTGRSEFLDDRVMFQNEVFVEPVYSPHAHAKILSIDDKKALRASGILAVYTAKDIPHNVWGTIFKDQPLLASDKVQYAGEVVALIVGNSLHETRKAKSLIEIKYQKLPAILSIQEAIEKKSFIGSERQIERGDFRSIYPTCAHKIEDSITIRGADHFYLESQCSVVYPNEDGQLMVHSSSQHPTETQHVVAHALGISLKNVVCVVKRMGGAFGGKESQAAPFAAYAALAAYRLNRPARIVLTKDDDMVITGKRNPFWNQYRVGFDGEGRIQALEVHLYSDGGAYADLSTSIMERAMLHADNAYFIPHIRVIGQVCKTHYHPHTAFRGFGGPKGVATIELIIEQIAHALNIDPLEIRKRNLYQTQKGMAALLHEKNVTHYGQIVENNCLSAILNQLEKTSEYQKRKMEIDQFNLSQRFHGQEIFLKGISLTPIKFGISFTTRFLNQANALVLIHRDGSLQVSTGATEMGQGVNTRIADLVASELGLHRDSVRMMPTSTDKNANTSPTAASTGTDLNGAAALMAVKAIKKRLLVVADFMLNTSEKEWATHTAGLGTHPEIDTVEGDLDEGSIIFCENFVYYKDHSDKKIKFKDLVNEAYLQRISLSEYSFYKIPGISFNKLSGQGNAFLYYTQGAAVSEVLINQMTGEVKVQRVDILMDLGRSANEGLDKGQITGAFIQGMGWVTTEKLFYDNGFLKSHSPSTYKIPSIQDIPRIFNVNLFENPHNVVNIRGMKAVGEPPLLLAISVWTAIHAAVRSAPQCKNRFPQMELPATYEEILKALWGFG